MWVCGEGRCGYVERDDVGMWRGKMWVCREGRCGDVGQMKLVKVKSEGVKSEHVPVSVEVWRTH